MRGPAAPPALLRFPPDHFSMHRSATIVWSSLGRLPRSYSRSLRVMKLITHPGFSSRQADIAASTPSVPNILPSGAIVSVIPSV